MNPAIRSPQNIGARITTLEELASVAYSRSAVLVKRGHYGGFLRMPASFLISMQARVVLGFFRTGVYQYIPNQSVGDENQAG